jgi:hypothetical protein
MHQNHDWYVNAKCQSQSQSHETASALLTTHVHSFLHQRVARAARLHSTLASSPRCSSSGTAKTYPLRYVSDVHCIANHHNELAWFQLTESMPNNRCCLHFSFCFSFFPLTCCLYCTQKIDTPIKTIQADTSNNVTFKYNRRELMDRLVWAGIEGLHITVGEGECML